MSVTDIQWMSSTDIHGHPQRVEHMFFLRMHQHFNYYGAHLFQTQDTKHCCASDAKMCIEHIGTESKCIGCEFYVKPYLRVPNPV